ncbi:winged helix-turn-helix domain-containing protein [Nitrosarchaeum sp. AC2]|uniref:winged helix-turn-helix domain-containing protein n=1 Tax=Nitrosarchaeum sp. AC2 TaxID=2259673 RepID=UPI0015C8CC6A|nr:hypothetical protein DSQ20_07095 [Nitrosarchaeum sp. AC2]
MLIKNSKKLKRVDMQIVTILFQLLHENGPLRKTPLMEKANLSYSRLILYLELLMTLDLIHITENTVSLTESGLVFMHNYLK